MEQTINTQAGAPPSIRRIGWLLDARTEFDRALVSQTLSSLRGSLDPNGCVIEPIRVIRPSLLHSVAHFLSQHLRAPMGIKASSLLKRKQGLPNLERCEILPPRVFNWTAMSDRSLSHYLSCYAQLSHTDLMVLPAKAWKKLFVTFGQNFPVSLSTETRTPVLIVSPNNQFRGQVSNILYPVIDPKRWADGFRDLLDLAQLSGAKITLLYRPYSDSVNGYWTSKTIQFGAIPFYEPSSLLEENSKLEILSTWINTARKRGVQVNLKLDKNSTGLMECILEHHDEIGFDLIALDPKILESPDFDQAWRELGSRAIAPLWVARPLGQSAGKDALHSIEERLRWAT